MALTHSHQGQHGPDCFGCKIRTVAFGASCTPGRRPEAMATMAREDRWNKDIPAYGELMKNGVQPRKVDGCADVAKSDATKFEIETGITVPTKAGKALAKDCLVELGHGSMV